MLIARPIGPSRSYGFEEHLQCLGSGTNLLRTSRFALPRTLSAGDVLAGGQTIAQPCEGFNSSVVIPIIIESNERGTIHEWMDTAPRLPIALQLPGDQQYRIVDVVGGRLRTERWAQPLALQEGDLLPTGDRVIATPEIIHGHDVKVKLTGGWTGHEIYIHYYLPIALLTDADEAPEGIWREARDWEASQPQE